MVPKDPYYPLWGQVTLRIEISSPRARLRITEIAHIPQFKLSGEGIRISKGGLAGPPGKRKIASACGTTGFHRSHKIHGSPQSPTFPHSSTKPKLMNQKEMVTVITWAVAEVVEADSPVKLEPRIFNRDGADSGVEHWRGEITSPDGRKFEVYYDPDDGVFSVSTRFPHAGRRESIDFDLADPSSFERAGFEILHWDVDGEEKVVNPRCTVKLAHYRHPDP